LRIHHSLAEEPSQAVVTCKDDPLYQEFERIISPGNALNSKCPVFEKQILRTVFCIISFHRIYKNATVTNNPTPTFLFVVSEICALEMNYH
jgi:hypothetical protein